MKYFIVPINETAAEVDADSASEALIDFATKMEGDMSMYFKAVTEDELRKITAEKNAEAEKRNILDFMEGELEGQFDVPVEEAVDLAEAAYEIYCRGDSDTTQYECIEAAYDEWRRNIKEELESKLKDYDLEGCEVSDDDVDVFISNLRGGNTREEATELILNDIRETLNEGFEDDVEALGVNEKENPVKSNNDRMFEELKTQLFLKGTDAIENFLGYSIPVDEDKDVIENRLNDVYQQMPEETFAGYCTEYGITPWTSVKDELVIKDYFNNELTFKLNGKWFHDECRKIAEEDADSGSIDEDEIETYANSLYENTSDETKEDVLKAALCDVIASGLECDDDEIQTSLDALGEIQKYIKNNGFEKEIVITVDANEMINAEETFIIYIDDCLNSCGINASEAEDIVMAYITGRKKSEKSA